MAQVIQTWTDQSELSVRQNAWKSQDDRLNEKFHSKNYNQKIRKPFPPVANAPPLTMISPNGAMLWELLTPSAQQIPPDITQDVSLSSTEIPVNHRVQIPALYRKMTPAPRGHSPPDFSPRNSSSRNLFSPGFFRASYRNALYRSWKGGKEKYTQLGKHWHETRQSEQNWKFPEARRRSLPVLLCTQILCPDEHVIALLRGGWKRLIQTLRYQPDRPLRERFPLHPAAYLIIGCMLLFWAYFTNLYTSGIVVSYQEQVIATMDSMETVQAVQEEFEEVVRQSLGLDYSLTDNGLTCEPQYVLKTDLDYVRTLEENLSEAVGLIVPAYCLYVDGELVGATPYRGALEELLVQIKSAYTNQDTISCEFKENIEIQYELVAPDTVMNLGHLAELLFSAKTEESSYEVQPDDTWMDIAQKNSMTVEELLALNPGYGASRLKAGEQLLIAHSKPYLTITVRQREYYLEEITYDIHSSESNYLYKGQTAVVQEGKNGAADVVANVTYVNGVKTDKSILSYVILKKPVTEERLEGVLELELTALSVGSTAMTRSAGAFRWPVSGRVSSTFGGRASPGGIGSTNHKGLDIAAPYGTPVCASRAGTVSYAGWMSGYGYLVEINHGDGYSTRYAHNSRLTVSVGQSVAAGQQIARVGSTGNSTGNHCHFEVRENNIAKNPLHYLP